MFCSVSLHLSSTENFAVKAEVLIDKLTLWPSPLSFLIFPVHFLGRFSGKSSRSVYEQKNLTLDF